MRTALLFLIVFSGAFAQTFDTSNTAALHGDYFVREVLITGQTKAGAITSAKSAIGLATFSGKGTYQFAGGGVSASGTYGVGANGLLYMQSIVDGTQKAYGGLGAVGPSAFVASATEGTTADTIVAIPAGTAVTAGAFKGNYTAGYIAFPGAAVAMVREGSLSVTADGAGNLTSAVVTGAALNLGGTQTSQPITGAVYTLSGEGQGVVNWGAASPTQILSGSMNFYISADGNLFLAGTPGGYDMVVGMRALAGAATNATWSGLYFATALEDAVTNGVTPVHAIDAFYGSWNATGTGISLTHERFQSLAPTQGVMDYTFGSQWTVPAGGTVLPSGAPYSVALGASGQAFIGTGTSGLYSLLVGFASPVFSGTGVFLNPQGVVNAASFAPVTNPIAPGELITLIGTGLAPSTIVTPTLPLPTTLGGVQVTINGQAAPLFYVTPTQIVAQVPQAISPANHVMNATVQVVNNNVKSNAVTLFTNYSSPGVFSATANGIGFALAQRQNYSLLTAANPAAIGETIVLYANGLGAVAPAVADGAAAPSAVPLAKTSATDVVYIGLQAGSVVFNGLTPGLAGLYQLNTTIAAGTPIGVEFSDISTPDAYTSQTTVAVAAAGSSARPAGPRPAARAAGLPARAP